MAKLEFEEYIVLTMLAVSLLSFTLVQTPTPAGPVRVYLKPPADASSLVIDDSVKDRADSTSDLRKGLQRWKDTIVLVDDPAQAQVTVEVIRRSRPETGHIERSSLPGVAATKDTGHQLTVRVTTAAGQSGEMTETSALQFSSWGGVAKLMAMKIHNWIKDNRNKL